MLVKVVGRNSLYFIMCFRYRGWYEQLNSCTDQRESLLTAFQYKSTAY